MLQVENLTVRYQGLTAVDGLSFSIGRGDALGLIGANGAGKSSAINAITGVTTSHGGSVRLDGRELRGKPTYQIARAGLGRTFQQARLWPVLTIRENLSLASQALNTPKHLDDMANMLGLGDLLEVPAASVAYGSRRLVEVLRAALLRPKIVLLDEPAAGLSSRDKVNLGEFLAHLRREGVGTLIVDHDMTFIRQTCAYLHVLEGGRLLAQGHPEEVFAMASVRESYLGSEAPHA